MKSGPETIKVDQSLVDTLVKARELANKGQEGLRVEYGGSVVIQQDGKLKIQPPKEGTFGGWRPSSGEPADPKKGESFDGFYHVHPNEGVLGPMSFSGNDIGSLAGFSNWKQTQLRSTNSYLIAGNKIYILSVYDRELAKKANNPDDKEDASKKRRDNLNNVVKALHLLHNKTNEPKSTQDIVDNYALAISDAAMLFGMDLYVIEANKDGKFGTTAKKVPADPERYLGK